LNTENKNILREENLAITAYAYENILSRQVGRVTIQSLKINVIVYSLLPEEPLQWKKPESFTNNV